MLSALTSESRCSMTMSFLPTFPHHIRRNKEKKEMRAQLLKKDCPFFCNHSQFQSDLFTSQELRSVTSARARAPMTCFRPSNPGDEEALTIKINRNVRQTPVFVSWRHTKKLYFKLSKWITLQKTPIAAKIELVMFTPRLLLIWEGRKINSTIQWYPQGCPHQALHTHSFYPHSPAVLS